MHRGGFSVGLDSPAPDSPPGSGGLVVALSSDNVDRVNVPAQVIVPTGQTTASFTATGLAATPNNNPVTITATTGTSTQMAQISVAAPALGLFDVQTSRSTFSRPQTIRGFILNPACSFCGDALNSSLTFTFSATDPTNGPSSIVSITPDVVTIPAGDFATSQVQSVTIGAPTGTGQYVVNLAAPGLTTVSSSAVTVTQPSITSLSGGTVSVVNHR